MKIGDLVLVHPRFDDGTELTGVIVGFNKKGEGGKDFVHVLCNGKIEVFMEFDIKVVKNESR